MSRAANDYRTNSRAVYNKFCSTYPEVKISFEKWKEVLQICNGLIRQVVLETGDKFKFPWGLGTLVITKKKTKDTKTYKGVVYNNLPIDWQKTKKYGKYYFHLNSHTDGYRYRWKWFSSEARFAHSSIWYFKASRIASRELKSYLTKPNSLYPQIYKNWTNGVLL